MRLHLLAHTALELRANTILGMFEQLDAFRRPERLAQFRARLRRRQARSPGIADSDYPQARYLTNLFHAALQPKAQPLLDAGLSGPELGAALREARLGAIAAAMSAAKKNPAA